jgi:hypothetical protein
MKTEEKIYTQHTENNDWINSLKFYGDEIRILIHRLQEVASLNNHMEVLAQVEHFQNQFLIQKSNIDELSHIIKINEEALLKEIKNNPVSADHRKMEYHLKERERFIAFENNFKSMRAEFNAFVAKWL